jgi:hypothetical protein
MSRESVKSLAEKRVRRQKIFIAVGSVLLLAILGFELPKVMGGKGGGEAAATTATTPVAAVPGAATPVVPVGTLPNTDRVLVVRDSDQLISFGLFKSKDPFVQQLSTTPDGTSAPGTTPPAAAPSAGETTPSGTSGGTPSSPTPAVVPPGAIVTPTTPSVPGSTETSPTTTPAAPVAAPTDALIATNGVCERISVKGTFPANENIFRLVSVAKDGKSVEVGIVGGSFDNGHPTAKLGVGKKITLVNTADGTRYEIVLKASCDVTAPAGSTTQSTTTTPIAPSPTTTTTPADTAPATTTATTPIVTDTLDTTTSTTTTTTTPSS